MRCSEMEISFERCNWRLPELDAACFGMPSAASRFWCKSSRMRFPGMGQVGRIWAEQVKPSPHSAVWSFAFAGKNRNLQISDDYDVCIGHHMLCVCVETKWTALSMTKRGGKLPKDSRSSLHTVHIPWQPGMKMSSPTKRHHCQDLGPRCTKV